jgi:hypothetical protein
VQGQQGYNRAIAGMRAPSSGVFDRAAARMPNAAQPCSAIPISAS